MNHRKPRIGLLGIMQSLYDDMLPGITERQANYAAEVARQLADVAEVHFPKPVKSRAELEEVVAGFEREPVDGVMVVMLTYSPAMRATRALTTTRLPLLLANIQPEPEITPRWDMGDMTYNQGIHGAQDTANALVRANIPFAVVSEDWRAEAFKEAFADWAHAAAAISFWRQLRVAVFGYAMNGMGDIRVDETALLRKLGPEVNFLATGDLIRAMEKVSSADLQRLLAEEDGRFEIDERLTREEREDAARMQLAFQRTLEAGGYGAFSAHFDAIGEDGRFCRLPLAAASSLMAAGYGYGAEGDACSAALVAAGHVLAGDAHFTEMYAMDFGRDSVLMSHMGEGNWRVARRDEKVKLIHRELGIGRLAAPPTFLFRLQPGPATLASLIPLRSEHFRLLISEGELLDSEEMPALEMPYGHYRPNSGVRACLDAWLRAGGTHHQCLNLGHIGARWRLFSKLLGLEVLEA